MFLDQALNDVMTGDPQSNLLEWYKGNVGYEEMQAGFEQVGIRLTIVHIMIK